MTVAIDIPVLLIDQFGQERPDNPQFSPCIRCILSLDGAGTASTGELVALLDTGAYPIAVSRDVLRQMGSAAKGHDTVFTAGSSGVTEVHGLLLWIRGLPPLQVDVLATDHRMSGLPYDVILGRQFLTLFDFAFDQEKQAWRLSMPERHF